MYRYYGLRETAICTRRSTSLRISGVGRRAIATYLHAHIHLRFRHAHHKTIYLLPGLGSVIMRVALRTSSHGSLLVHHVKPCLPLSPDLVQISCQLPSKIQLLTLLTTGGSLSTRLKQFVTNDIPVFLTQ